MLCKERSVCLGGKTVTQNPLNYLIENFRIKDCMSIEIGLSLYTKNFQGKKETIVKNSPYRITLEEVENQ